jgi:hypothetical protein
MRIAECGMQNEDFGMGSKDFCYHMLRIPHSEFRVPRLKWGVQKWIYSI